MAFITGTNANNTLARTNQDNTITGLQGNDTITGGGGNDIINAGPATATNSNLIMNWATHGLGSSNLSGGFTQNTGGVTVAVSYADNGAGTGFSYNNSISQYVNAGAGETYATQSMGYLTGNGSGPTSTVTMNFSSATNAGFRNEVVGVNFRLQDIDASVHTDVVTILAFDAAGNAVPVTITPADIIPPSDTVSGNTITSGPVLDNYDQNGSALVSIAGPAARIQIVYSNGTTGVQNIGISNVHFQGVPTDDDTVSGGDGNDIIWGALAPIS